MIKGSSGHFLDLTNTELGDLAWLAGGIYIEQNRFPNTVFPRQCFLLIEDEDIRNKVSYTIHCQLHELSIHMSEIFVYCMRSILRYINDKRVETMTHLVFSLSYVIQNQF
jgi:hypothetical protein